MTWGAPLAFLRNNLVQAGQGATSVGRDAYAAAVKAALDAVGIAGKAITVSSVAARKVGGMAKDLASTTLDKAAGTAGAIQQVAGRAKDVRCVCSLRPQGRQRSSQPVGRHSKAG